MVPALMLFKLLYMTGQYRHRKPCGLRLSDPLVLANCLQATAGSLAANIVAK